MIIGVAGTVGTIMGLAETHDWFRLNSPIKGLAYGAILLVSGMAFTATMCYLWAFLVGRRTYWWKL